MCSCDFRLPTVHGLQLLFYLILLISRLRLLPITTSRVECARLFRCTSGFCMLIFHRLIFHTAILRRLHVLPISLPKIFVPRIIGRHILQVVFRTLFPLMTLLLQMFLISRRIRTDLSILRILFAISRQLIRQVCLLSFRLVRLLRLLLPLLLSRLSLHLWR